MKMHTLIIIAALALTGCASGTGFQNHVAGSSPVSNTQTVRDANSATQYRIREGNLFTPNGTRVARIDSSGNIYSTQGSTAGQRVGRIK
jgi:hypothetical protein